MPFKRVKFHMKCQEDLTNLFKAFEIFKRQRCVDLKRKKISNALALSELLRSYNEQKDDINVVCEDLTKTKCVQDMNEAVSMDNSNGDGNNLNFSCSVCEKTFKLKQNLVRHSDVHTPNRVKCSECSSWLKKRNLKRHKLNYCKIKLNLAEDVDQAEYKEVSLSTNNENNEKIMLHSLGVQAQKSVLFFRDKKRFNEFKKKEQEERKNDKGGVVVDEISNHNDLPNYEIITNKCNFCGKKFQKIESVENHKKICTKRSLIYPHQPNLFYCHSCDVYVNDKSKFKYHCKRAHGETMSANRLLSCIVKNTKLIEPHKMLEFRKKGSKAVELIKRNVVIKERKKVRVVKGETDIEESCSSAEVIDNVCRDLDYEEMGV